MPLNVQQMVNAFIESSLLFLTDKGNYELEGDLNQMCEAGSGMNAARTYNQA